MWESLAQTGHISERIESQIASLIASRQLKTGDRLPSERELAVLLGVSRPTLREAMKSLQARGVVHVRHGQGVFIAPPLAERNLRANLRDEEITLSELFAMREVLEVPAAGWAANAQNEEALESVASALDELNGAASQKLIDTAELGRLDAVFHMRIVAAAGNRFLNQTLGVLQDMISSGMETTLKIPERVERSRADHARIIAAIREGDAAAARRAARRHILGARKAAMQRVEQQRLEQVAEESGEISEG